MIAETETLQIAPQKPKNRRFTAQDIKDIAQLASKRLSDKEACSVLGINYDSFRNWRSRERNGVRFGDAITKARAIAINAHVSNIEDAETGKNGHRKDWRASEALLRIKFPDLMPDKNQGQITNNVSLTVTMTDSLKRVFNAPAQVIDVPTTKALPEST